jgi:protein-L-isoaspartate(D-aspartate) O-methyltransferase
LAVFDPPDLSLPMIDFATARRNMVDGQVRTQDVTDLRVIDALLAVPREQFLPAAKAGVAYLDDDIALGEGATSRRLLKPMVLAKFMQLAAPRPGDRVLDIAGGTGYASALWARLVGSVTMLEEDSTLAKQAQKNLGGAAKVVTGALAAGWQANAPYNIILINGACEIEPKSISVSLRMAAACSASWGQPRARPRCICEAETTSAAGNYSMPRRRCCRNSPGRPLSSSRICL